MDDEFRTLRRHGYRLTPQRETIMKFMKITPGHPTAEEVFTYVRKSFPSISFSTVYNTLRTLKKVGLIRELAYNPSRFESSVEDHYHVICLKCNHIADFMWPPLKEVQGEVEKQTEYQIAEQDVGFFGLCPGCRSREKEEIRN